jgi:hypothetical protein
MTVRSRSEQQYHCPSMGTMYLGMCRLAMAQIDAL